MKRGSKLLRLVGCLLILCSLVTFLATRILTEKARTEAERTVLRISTILPERTAGTMDTYSSMEMPVLQVEGKDYAALLSVPSFGVELPVAANWDAGAVTSQPCRFQGTVYDGSLVVGGFDQQGQFDFLDRIDPGTEITVTDMNGAEFHYLVDRVDRAERAEAEVLAPKEAGLILFVRDAYSLEYLIVRCVAH
jgi:sortase A